MAIARAAWILLLFVTLLACSSASEASMQGNVTLQSLAIFTTHEWLGKKPSLYFQCAGEEKVELPDVKEKDRVYNFLGHESWQPLTEFRGTKCKRCGLYEKNEFLKDGVFDEWEFCPDEADRDGRYVHGKAGEFNATFLASRHDSNDEPTAGGGPQSASKRHRQGSTALSVLLVFCSLLIVLGLGVIAYMKWQQKKREEQQAKFIKLFEEDDGFDMELGGF